MDIQLKEHFLTHWARYFPGADLPIAFFYSNELEGAQLPDAPTDHRCVILDLGKVRKGETLAFERENLGCSGGKRYFGYKIELRPDFEYFLSCGIPGKIEGERYKKSPELVLDLLENRVDFEAPARYAIFKRWDRLTASDEPLVVIFFSSPDVLAGLFTLANFDESDPNGVIAPFASACGSIVHLPYLETQQEQQRAILGHFDITARTYLKANRLSFAVPFKKFVRMVNNMEQSFLITSTWEKMRIRMEQGDSKKEPSK